MSIYMFGSITRVGHNVIMICTCAVWPDSYSAPLAHTIKSIHVVAIFAHNIMTVLDLSTLSTPLSCYGIKYVSPLYMNQTIELPNM